MNSTNLEQFLSDPATKVEAILTDDNVKQEIDEKLVEVAKEQNRAALVLKKDFKPIVNDAFDGSKNFERYCLDNCLENEILIHHR